MRRIIILGVFFLTYQISSAQSEANEILGVWLTGTKKGKVEIYKCGNKYCGKIVWLREPLNDQGRPKLDKNNPDPVKRKKQILGLDILSGFEYDEDYEWEDGEIYDPDNGKTYSCLMELQDDKKTLEVRGYIGISLIGRTEYWQRTTLD